MKTTKFFTIMTTILFLLCAALTSCTDKNTTIYGQPIPGVMLQAGEVGILGSDLKSLASQITETAYPVGIDQSTGRYKFTGKWNAKVPVPSQFLIRIWSASPTFGSADPNFPGYYYNFAVVEGGQMKQMCNDKSYTTPKNQMAIVSVIGEYRVTGFKPVAIASADAIDNMGFINPMDASAVPYKVISIQ